MSFRWPGSALGGHAWVLIAMFQLAVDLPSCEALGPGPEFRLLLRPPSRPPRPWGLRSGQPTRVPVPVWGPRPLPSPRGARRAHRPRDQAGALVPKAGLARSPAAARPGPSLGAASTAAAPAGQQPLSRARRHLQVAALGAFDARPGRPTPEPEFIAWGPTGEEEGPEGHTVPGALGPTTAHVSPTRRTTMATTITTATAATPTTLQSPGATEPLGPGPRFPFGTSTTEPPTRPGRDARPPRVLGESSGLAVHQIVTITVSLIMVIAALVTTLVLKNCCAQSGRARRSGRQRKLQQQEESCQNLTDFAPARVPSTLDVFTAYNETLQCSHECVRASVPVYADDTLRSVGEFKSTFNGNRPPSSDRHLIPVAFVSEKWFEISC
ncbi:adherens junction-associated protein 1 isoform X2 [Sorex araneus]|nr:adherens junction-associated protein 1 isoform X2 [Sorex araneus]XP_054993785.1 adherens junction-associated protein 1 isoform X2 [Sorex araneus]XP_054993786.1 adherens junction-associated protein 1 isoform X2 [Sorex araneus]XP_054993787.1 adherens junction-associated protein 1 isoform X2 [Sorex araneus]